MINHILLEIYCNKNFDNNINKPIPCYCPKEGFIPNYTCLLNKCPFCLFSSHENSVCFVNDKSEAEEIISLGGEMLVDYVDHAEALDIWKTISLRKINEAYYEFMNEIGKKKKAEKTGDGTKEDR